MTTQKVHSNLRHMDCTPQCQKFIKAFFAACPPASQAVIHSQEFEIGEEIPFKLENEEGFWMISRGRVKVDIIIGEIARTLDLYNAGEVIGYGASEGYRLRAFTLTPTKVCFFKTEAVNRSQAQSPYVLAAFTQLTQKVLSDSYFKIWLTSGRTVRARVAAALKHLAERSLTNKGTHTEHILIERRILADYTHMAAETISRVLTDLEKEGVILRKGAEVIIINKTKMAKIATEP